MRERRLKWIGLALLLAVPLFIWAQGSATKNLSITVAPAPGGFSVGWKELLGTTPNTQCPSTSTFPGIGGGTGCDPAVMSAWNGGWADTKRNLLLFMGGGHSDYYGNEIYYVDPVASTVGRLTNPATNPNISCSGTLTQIFVWQNGTENAAHNYTGTTYMPNVDKSLFAMGDLSRGNNTCPVGALSDAGGRRWDSWLFNNGGINYASLPNAAGNWTPLPTLIGGAGISFVAHPLCTNGACGTTAWGKEASPIGEWPTTAWDPIAQQALLHDQFSIYYFDPLTSVGTQLSASGALNTSGTSNTTGAIDAPDRIFWITGNGQGVKFDLKTFAASTPATTGCSTPFGVPAPGIDFDPTMGVFVLVGQSANPGRVWLFNPTSSAKVTANYGTINALTCVAVDPPQVSGVPPAAPYAVGNLGRFRILPNVNGQDVGVYCPKMNANCEALVLNAASTAGHKTFAQRVAGTQGLVYSNSLDTTAKVNEGSIVASSQGPIRVSLNTLVSPPGDGLAGSLQFFAPSTCTGTRCSGDWESPIWNTSMGPPTHPGLNPDLYMQIRVMRDTNYAATDWVTTGGNGQKMFILHNGSTTCASIEGTLEDTFQRGYLQMYTDCGGQAFVKDLGNGDFLREQSTPIDSTTNNQMRYNCHANFQSGIECAYYEGRSSSALQYANGWMTIEVHFHFTGEWSGSTANTTVTAWVSYDKGTTMPDGTVSDGSAHQWMNFQPHFNCNNTPGCVATSSNEGFNRIDLLNYETNGAPTGRTTDGFLYYSALIVATGTIPFPDGWTPQ